MSMVRGPGRGSYNYIDPITWDMLALYPWLCSKNPLRFLVALQHFIRGREGLGL